MSKVEEIIAIIEKASPGLLESLSREDGMTKESLVRKVLALSRGQMVYTHQIPETDSQTQEERSSSK